MMNVFIVYGKRRVEAVQRNELKAADGPDVIFSHHLNHADQGYLGYIHSEQPD